MPQSIKGLKRSVESCFISQVDSGPTNEQRDEVYSFFENKCSICGDNVTRGFNANPRERALIGHIDPDGLNHISNRALMHDRCRPRVNHRNPNFDYKEYIRSKAPDDDKANELINKLESWKNQNALSELEKEKLEFKIKKVRSMAKSMDKLFDYFEMEITDIIN